MRPKLYNIANGVYRLRKPSLPYVDFSLHKHLNILSGFSLVSCILAWVCFAIVFCVSQEMFLIYFVFSSTNVVIALFGNMVNSSNFLGQDGGSGIFLVVLHSVSERERAKSG